jgi:hypothetical protein
MTASSLRLPVTLTGEEIADRARMLATKTIAYSDIETQKKDATRDFNDQMKTLRRECGELASAVTTGTERRDIPCHQRDDLRRFVVQTIRDDTYEVVDEEAMTPERMLPSDDAVRLLATVDILVFELADRGRTLDEKLRELAVAGWLPMVRK